MPYGGAGKPFLCKDSLTGEPIASKGGPAGEVLLDDGPARNPRRERLPRIVRLLLAEFILNLNVI
jgi:hypothetical protein